MKQVLALALTGLVGASATAQLAQRDRPRARASGPSQITGVVVSDESEPRPLRRAHVTLQSPELPRSEIETTADDGTFTFAGLPAGRYTVSAAKSAYVSMSYGARAPLRPGATLILEAGETKKITIRLPRGAVITGVLTDAEEKPMPAVTVVALSYRFSPAAGERRLLPAAGAAPSTTDENGVYRIYGLPPGEYFVGTQTRQTGVSLSTVTPADVRAALAEARSTGTNQRRIPSTLTPKEPQAPKANVVLAPVYYPGTAVTAEAAPVAVGKGEERSGVDFQVVPVPSAAVSGSLPLTVPRPFVTLRRRDEPLPPGSEIRSAQVDPFGRFSLRAVVPGRYTVSALVARPSPASGTKGDTQWATTDITVDGEDAIVGLTLQPALTIAGRVTFEGGAPSLSPTRLPLPVVSPISGAPSPFVQLEPDGRFTISGLVGGSYRLGLVPGIRARVGSWWLKSIVMSGRELLDGPVDLQRDVSDAVVTFSNRATELTGRVTASTAGEQPSVFVIVFTTNRAGWFPSSRRVAGVRPDDDGRYTISNLPPGEYFAVVEDNVDPNEWFDPVLLDRLIPQAIRFTLGPDEARTLDLVAR